MSVELKLERAPLGNQNESKRVLATIILRDQMGRSKIIYPR
jgi:hypothetical protein